jgi:3-deoxy-D-manno-octulosonic-acid transferase
VLFGPHTENCAALAERLEAQGAAVRVRGEEDLAAEVERLLSDAAEAERRGFAAHAAVAAGAGAARRTVDFLRERGVLP